MFINFASYSFYFFNLSVNVCLSSSACNMHSSYNKVKDQVSCSHPFFKGCTCC